MSLDTIILQSFIAVAESGSFTKAASRVGRTQSAITQQIAKLENLLSKTLFIRGKNLVLTQEGEVFLSYARQIFCLHREAIDRFKEPELEGEVSFGLPENFASFYLSQVLSEFMRVHPRILLKIECDLTMNLFKKFKNNEFDLVLVKMNRPEDFPNGNDIWTEPLKWVGDENLLVPDKPIPLILSPQPCVYRASALKSLEEAGISWRIIFSSPSYTGTLAAAKAGMGITVMSQKMIPSELKSIEQSFLPKLSDTHVSLLKHTNNNYAVNTLEDFVLRRLSH